MTRFANIRFFIAPPSHIWNDFDVAVEASALAQLEGKRRMRVLVMVDDVADGEPVAAAGDVDLPGRIISHRPLAHLQRAMLSPRLVERHPLDDAGMVVQQVDHGFQFGHELPVRASRPDGVHRIGFQPRPDGAGILAATPFARAGTDLVLPHHHPEAVAVIVVPARFNLDVLADRVEAGGFQELDVRPHGFIRRRRQQAVGPPALVQGSPGEDRLAVQRKPQMAVSIPFDAGFPKTQVRFHHVVADDDFQIVQGRRSRGPGPGRRGADGRGPGRRHRAAANTAGIRTFPRGKPPCPSR
jgi:hypothetical protein